MVPAWIQILQALLTPAIAVAVGAIGFLQWRTAHQKVVLDLFDRRISIYRGVRSTIDDAVLHQQPIDKNLLQRIHQLKQEAVFLFGDDVTDKITSLEKVLIDIEVYLISEVAARNQIPNFVKTWDEVKVMSEMKVNATILLEEISSAMKPYMGMHQKRVRSPYDWMRDRNEFRKSFADRYQK